MANPINSCVGDRDQKWARLEAARTTYEQQRAIAYDEVLVEVAVRIATAGSIGKSDIGALLLWKRVRADTRWARRLMSTAETEVRTVTARAVDAVCDAAVSVPEAARMGRRLLSSLPGFTTGDALASALLVAAAPTAWLSTTSEPNMVWSCWETVCPVLKVGMDVTCT